MTALTAILLIVAGIIAFLLIIALFMKREHYVKGEIIINASRQKVFDYIKLLKNQDEITNMQWLPPTGKENSKEQTEQLDIFMPGAEIKMPVKEKRKLRISLKGKELKQKFAL